MPSAAPCIVTQTDAVLKKTPLAFFFSDTLARLEFDVRNPFISLHRMSSALFGLARQACQTLGKRCMSSGAEDGFKVAVLGAAGGIGQPLSLLMKVRLRLTESMHDHRCSQVLATLSLCFYRVGRTLFCNNPRPLPVPCMEEP
jgi:hypothetical protein